MLKKVILSIDSQKFWVVYFSITIWARGGGFAGISYFKRFLRIAKFWLCFFGCSQCLFACGMHQPFLRA
jgi:hypothetical protein